MKTTALQLTLREMRALVTSYRTWVIFAGVILILGISGPFQTFEYFPLGPRLAYWTINGAASYFVGSFFGTWASHASDNWKVLYPFRFMAIGLAAGLPVSIVVILINGAALNDFGTVKDALLLMVYCIGISMAIVGLIMAINTSHTTEDAIKTAPILDRLPAGKRGKLLSLSVQDHYVEVVTTRGKHLTLIRLSDAIAEPTGTNGLQVHRSHWVAFEAINAVKRNEGKVRIHTQNGEKFPVSRTYIPKLKESGLLV